MSCCTLVYIFNTTLEEAMKRIELAGYKGVDILTAAPYIDRLDYATEERRKVKKLAESLRLKIIGLSLNGRSPCSQLQLF